MTVWIREQICEILTDDDRIDASIDELSKGPGGLLLAPARTGNRSRFLTRLLVFL